MAEMFKVNAPVRKPLFEGVQGENEARSIVFDITPWVEELGDGAVTATAKRSQDSQPYPVTVTKDGTTVTWKPTSTDTAFAGVGSFQLEYTVDSVLAKTCIWSTMVAPSLDPAGDPPDPYDNWLAEMREIAADAIQAAQDADESADDAQAEVYEAEAWAKGTKNGTPVSSSDAQYQNNAKYFAEESYKNAEAWAVGQRGGVDVPSTDPTYENNAKYWAEQSQANQYGAYIVKNASGDIASFSDGADNVQMKSVNVTITPKQSGSGDPSPSNVRPITGWTDADVHVTGKNMWSDVFSEWATPNDYSIYKIPLEQGKQYTVTCRLTGTAVTGATVGITRKGNKYSEFDTPTSWRFIATDGSIPVPQVTYTIDSTWTDPALIMFVANNAQNFQNVFDNYEIQIEEGTTPTAFEPYTGHTTTATFGQTVYGGEMDVVNGEGGKTLELCDFASITWSSNVANENGVIRFSGTASNKANGVTNIISSHFKTNEVIVPQNTSEELISGYSSSKVVYISIKASRLTGDLSTATGRQTAFINWCTANDVVVLYESNAPTQITFDHVSGPSILGTNNVWADCGSVSVEYRADPTLAYAELQALILENM